MRNDNELNVLSTYKDIGGLNIKINQKPLVEWLAPFTENDLDLTCAFNYLWGEQDQVTRDIRSKLNSKEKQILPILTCPDDMDLYCSTVYMTVEHFEDRVVWSNFGRWGDEGKDYPKEIDVFKCSPQFEFHPEEFDKIIQRFGKELKIQDVKHLVFSAINTIFKQGTEGDVLLSFSGQAELTIRFNEHVLSIINLKKETWLHEDFLNHLNEKSFLVEFEKELRHHLKSPLYSKGKSLNYHIEIINDNTRESVDFTLVKKLEKLKLYCLSGLGVDERAFVNLDIEKYDVIHVPWIEMHKNESLKHYAARLLEHMRVEKDYALLGLSFGGMLAQEMAILKAPKQLYLISTARSVEAVNPFLRVLIRLNLHVLLPGVLFQKSNRIAEWFFGARSNQAKIILKEILADTDPTFVKRAISSIARWKGVPILAAKRFHGNTDKLISPPKELDVLLENEGHLAVIEEGERISKFINEA